MARTILLNRFKPAVSVFLAVLLCFTSPAIAYCAPGTSEECANDEPLSSEFAGDPLDGGIVETDGMDQNAESGGEVVESDGKVDGEDPEPDGSPSLDSFPDRQDVIEQSDDAGRSNVTSFQPESAERVAQEQIDALANANRGTIAPGDYVIGSALSSKYVLDVSGGSTSNCANVQIYQDNNTSAQRWRIIEDEQGYLQIINIGSRKALDVSGGSSLEGANVWQYSQNGSAAQKWIAVRSANGVVLYSALGNNLILDVLSGGTSNGVNVQVYSKNGSAAQEFCFYPVGGLQPGERVIADGTYVLSSSGSAMGIRDSDTKEGAVAQSCSDNGSLAQSFYFEFDESAGFYTITAAHSGLLLDADKGSMVPGATVSQWGESPSGLMQRYWAVSQNPDGTYSIVNAANGQFLSFAGESLSSAVVTLPESDSRAGSWVVSESSFAWSKSEMDEWARDASSKVADGVYVIKSGVSARKVVDVSSGSLVNGANVQLYESNGSNAQRWRVETLEDGYVCLTNVGSGKVLDVYSAIAESGTNVQQYSSNSSRAQKWLPIEVNGGVVLYSALGCGLVLDVAGGSSNNGANVDIYSFNGSKAQIYSLIPVDANVDQCEDLKLDGWHVIRSRINNEYVLDVANGSSANGANVQLYQANQTLAQLYRFEYADGWYRIQSALGGYLDVAGGDPVAGSNVQLWSNAPGNKNQQWAVERNSDGSFSFTNRATGLVLDVSGGSASNGTNINAYEPNGTAAQGFFVERSTGLMPEGVFEVRSVLSSRPALDVSSGSAAVGSNVQIYDANGSPAQKWNIVRVEGADNTYTLQSLASGLYLAVENSGNVIQAGLSVGDAACWSPEILQGSYVLRNIATGLVLDVDSGSSASGTNVQVYTSNGTNAQRFALSSTDILSPGTYIVRFSLNAAKVLDVENGSYADGANVRLFASNDTGAQKWNIVRNPDGSYTFVNCASGKALDVSNGIATNGANVQQYERNSSSAQKWLAKWDASAGGYVFTSALDSRYVLDIAGGSGADGANAQLYEANGSKAQAFTLLPTVYVPPIPANLQAMINRANGYSSGTGYLILVSRAEHLVGVFSGSRGNWNLIHNWTCVVGKPSTPTITGTFRTSGFKRPHLTTDSRAIYCTQISGGYFFHSILVSESELGNSLSHGCVRLPYDAAYWIYTNIGAGTTVAIYD